MSCDAPSLGFSPQKESQKADEYLREIQELGQLIQAVEQCIEAAGHEHQPDMQKSLLRVGLEGAWREDELEIGWAGHQGKFCSISLWFFSGGFVWKVFP